MKVKYFVRGLGLGILVTALILGISNKSKNSDEDIILRAKKLGMVFADDASGSSIGIDEQKTDEPLVTTEPPATAEPTATAKPTKEPKEEQTAKPKSKRGTSTEEPELISFSIDKGDWASTVSEKLEDLGIIDDAKKFDKYLADNGYSVRIKVGDFKAKKGSTYKEIAKMITN